MPFSGSSHTVIHDALPFAQEDYFVLVDTTGRAIRDDKPSAIRSDIPPILQRFAPCIRVYGIERIYG